MYTREALYGNGFARFVLSRDNRCFFRHVFASFMFPVAKPASFVLWVLKERNDTGSFRLERPHEQRAEVPD